MPEGETERTVMDCDRLIAGGTGRSLATTHGPLLVST